MSRDSKQVVPSPMEIDREWAISMFGVTYLHEGDYQSPIVEIVGRHSARTLPSYPDGLFFSLEADAVRYVRDLARNAAQRDLREADAFQTSRSLSGKLWLAERFGFLKERYSSLVALDEIVEAKRVRAATIVKRGFRPTIRRTRRTLRMPLVLKDDAELFVVDRREFLRPGKRIFGTRIVEKVALPAAGAPFDVAVRYRLEGLPGMAAFDTHDRTTRRLTRYPDGLEVFLTRSAAERHLEAICERVEQAVAIMRTELVGICDERPIPLIEKSSDEGIVIPLVQRERVVA